MICGCYFCTFVPEPKSLNLVTLTLTRVDDLEAER